LMMDKMEYWWRPVSASLLLLLALTATASADWHSTGPYGGDAELVRVVPKSRGFVIAGTHNGLLFTSSNGGASWSNIPFEGQLSGTLHALEVDPRSTGTWFAGMEGDHPWTSGIYKTVDGGQSWKLLPGIRGKAVWSLALWPMKPDVIAAGTEDGIYRSLDGGASWDRISPEDNPEFRPVVSLAFDPSNREIIYAGTTHLPWRTSNGGASWEPIHTGMIDDSDVFSIQVDVHKPDSVYASACSGLYQSSDSAAHWKQLDTPKGAFRTWFVALDPRHEGFVFAGTTLGLLRSENGGKIWRLVSSEAVRSIAFDPAVSERIFFASTTGGLMLSTDGGRTLRQSNVGFTNRSFTVLTGAHGVLYASSVFEPGTGGIYRTANFGLRWERTGGEPEIRLMTAAPDQPGTLYGAGYHGVLKSKDGGKTWTQKASQVPGWPDHFAVSSSPRPRSRRDWPGAFPNHHGHWWLANGGNGCRRGYFRTRTVRGSNSCGVRRAWRLCQCRRRRHLENVRRALPVDGLAWLGFRFGCDAHGARGHLRRLVPFDRRLRFVDPGWRGFVGGYRGCGFVPSHQARRGVCYPGRPGTPLGRRRPELAAARR
jgi:photosystem II stability/assembly factor-like uncharacterized protein